MAYNFDDLVADAKNIFDKASAKASLTRLTRLLMPRKARPANSA